MKSKTRTADKVYGESKKPETRALTDDEVRIKRAIELQNSIAEQKQELESIKQHYIKRLGKVASKKEFTTIFGVAIAENKNSYSLKEEFIPNLKEVFKKSYKDFVKETRSYGLTAAMKKLLSDGDYEHKDVIRKATEITTAPSVKFIPVDPKKN